MIIFHVLKMNSKECEYKKLIYIFHNFDTPLDHNTRRPTIHDRIERV